MKEARADRIERNERTGYEEYNVRYDIFVDGKPEGYVVGNNSRRQGKYGRYWLHRNDSKAVIFSPRCEIDGQDRPRTVREEALNILELCKQAPGAKREILTTWGVL